MSIWANPDTWKLTFFFIPTFFHSRGSRIPTGCPISKFPLCFGCFLGFWSTYRGTSDLYSTALEICYTIATRILKIDLEIAEIFEVKVGTRHFEIDILLLHRSGKLISMLKVATLTSIISAISKSNLKILVPIK